MEAYFGLGLSAFLAATVLPFSSEAVLAALTVGRTGTPWDLWLVASVANTAGSMVNWGLGRFCLRFADRRWFPFSPEQMAAAGERFRRWGSWSLLFAWVPVVGDPLTFAAGVMRTGWRTTLLLVGIGKAARYAVVMAAAGQLA